MITNVLPPFLMVHSVYTYKGIQNCAISSTLDSRWSDRRETLHVNRVGHEHENSQGPMSIALC